MARRSRRTSIEIAGATEAARIALTLGAQARVTRQTRRQPLRVIASSLDISVTRLGELERGDGARAPLETWIALGISLGRPLAVHFSRPLGEPGLPTDIGHLEIQEHILALGRATGRAGTFELPTRPTDPARSTDVGLNDARNRTRIHVECWNTFGDLGAAVRATNRKVAEAAATWPDDRITTVWVVRASAANRALLARFPNIVDAAFPGSSRTWTDALKNGTAPPTEPGLVWYDPGTKRLVERRRATIAE